MKRQWQALAARFNGLSLRERAMVAVAVLALAGFLLFTLALSPQLQAQQRLASQIAQQRQEAADLQAKLKQITDQAANPDAALNARFADLRRQVAQIDDKFKAIEHKLVPPSKVTAVLQSMLDRNHGLKLVALRTLPPASLIESDASPAKTLGADPAAGQSQSAQGGTAGPNPPPQAGAGIYKHAVEITVQGGYRELLAYLAQLERAPQQLFWNKASLRADYPRSTLTLVVFTLSTERTWLSV